MSRKLKDIIPAISSQLKPRSIDNSVVREEIIKRRKQSKVQYDKKASQPIKKLEIKDSVWVKPREKNKPWVYGKIVEKPDERSCVMQTPLGLVRHIRKVKQESQERQAQINQDIEIISLPESDGENVIERKNNEGPCNESFGTLSEEEERTYEEQKRKNGSTLSEEEERTNEGTHILRRSDRVRKKPNKYKDYVLG